MSVNIRSGIVGNQVGDPLSTKLHSANLGKLVPSLILRYPVDGKATLGVVDEPEVLSGLLNGDDIHETSWEGWVGADLVVDLDQTLHDDGFSLTSVQSILQPVFRMVSELVFHSYYQKYIQAYFTRKLGDNTPVSDEDDQWHAFPLLVRSRGSLWSIFSGDYINISTTMI